MDFVLLVLAVFGFLGAARLAGHALLRLLSRGVETFLTREVSQTHARRGDLTALQASDAAHAVARRSRMLALGAFAASVALLIVPAFTPWPALMYACYLPLWFLRRRRPGN